jgi:hypothetical protein
VVYTRVFQEHRDCIRGSPHRDHAYTTIGAQGPSYTPLGDPPIHHWGTLVYTTGGEARTDQEEPGGASCSAKRGQEKMLMDANKNQEEPGDSEEPREAKRSQEEPGEARRSQEEKNQRGVPWGARGFKKTHESLEDPRRSSEPLAPLGALGPPSNRP